VELVCQFGGHVAYGVVGSRSFQKLRVLLWVLLQRWHVHLAQIDFWTLINLGVLSVIERKEIAKKLDACCFRHEHRRTRLLGQLRRIGRRLRTRLHHILSMSDESSRRRNTLFNVDAVQVKTRESRVGFIVLVARC
jgi:hypothetical protein